MTKKEVLELLLEFLETSTKRKVSHMGISGCTFKSYLDVDELSRVLSKKLEELNNDRDK